MFARLALGLVLAAAAATPAAAFFWGPLMNDPNTGSLERIPPCASAEVGGTLVGRFNQTEATYWNGRHTMIEVRGLRETGVRPQRDDLVARRWCEGTALFTDGARRRVVAELSSNTRWLGLTWGVSLCVDGLDRHMTYAPACRVLRQREF